MGMGNPWEFHWNGNINMLNILGMGMGIVSVIMLMRMVRPTF